jgi:outer membrane protein
VLFVFFVDKIFFSRMKRFRQPVLGLLIILFTGLTEAHDLVSAYQQAVQEDPQLERAREALAAIQETQVQASAALFLPEVIASANVNKDTQNVQFSGAGATGVNGRSSFMTGGYTLTLTQPIICNLQTHNRIHLPVV